MILLAIVLALLLEQVRPQAAESRWLRSWRLWPRAVAHNIDNGEQSRAWLAWTLAVALPALATGLVHGALQWLGGWPFTLAWTVIVLYFSLGLRHFSQRFVGVRDALQLGDEERARELLGQWLGCEVGEQPRTELIRLVLEQSFLASHRLVFGVLIWFCILAVPGLGPAGAVFYRLAKVVAMQWNPDVRMREGAVSAPLARVAATAWFLIDWLPARATALGLAIVGSFEDAIDVWRRFAARFPDANDGVILAAASGAMNVRLGGAQSAADPLPGELPASGHFARAVGLLWRLLALWLLLLVLLTLAHVLG